MVTTVWSPTFASAFSTVTLPFTSKVVTEPLGEKTVTEAASSFVLGSAWSDAAMGGLTASRSVSSAAPVIASRERS